MNPKFPGVYGFAGFILLLLGLFGFQYGAAIFYWPLALICFSLICYPTLFCWGLITFAYILAALIYIGFTIIELLTKGQNSPIFSDGILVYGIYVAIIILLAFFLLMAKPSDIDDNTDR
ncbi:hypothetical protein [Zooshikella ganghwensis]|uniref:hypothetical protein n=1 Tax=Zooshikella ganghwensis TaxID=202772 RepID=UPI00146FC07F|nr:hypothetical protein [Zooshikella ganghwensis]